MHRLLAKCGDIRSADLTAALEQQNDCIKLIDLHGYLVAMSGAGCRLMQIPDPSLVEGKLWRELWPAESASLIDDALFEARANGSASFRAFCPTYAGEPRWWDVAVKLLHGPEGEPAGYLSSSRDVSAYVQETDSQRVIVAEMRHRLKNSYGLMLSLIRGMARQHPEAREFAEEVEVAVQSLAKAQSQFATEGQTADVDELILSVVAPLAALNGGHIELSRGQMRCGRSQADVIALALGELAVNSVKHGAFGTGGLVRISAKNTHPDLVVAWDEATELRQSDPAMPGSGHMLIARMAQAGGGRFETEWRSDGLHAELTLRI